MTVLEIMESSGLSRNVVSIRLRSLKERGLSGRIDLPFAGRSDVTTKAPSSTSRSAAGLSHVKTSMPMRIAVTDATIGYRFIRWPSHLFRNMFLVPPTGNSSLKNRRQAELSKSAQNLPDSFSSRSDVSHDRGSLLSF